VESSAVFKYPSAYQPARELTLMLMLTMPMKTLLLWIQCASVQPSQGAHGQHVRSSFAAPAAPQMQRVVQAQASRQLRAAMTGTLTGER
jgi:hypothetical protein